MNQEQLKRIQAKLKKLKSGGGGSWFRPPEGRTQVRFTPYPHGEDPFLEYYYHYNVGGSNIPMVCPKRTFGQSCPICDLTSQLWKGDEGDQKLAKLIGAKMRVHAPVIVRGEEDKGVRFWSFGQQVYQSILETMVDPDYGNVADAETGRDVVINYTPATTGNPFPKTELLFKPKETPLSDPADVEKGIVPSAKELIKSIPDIQDLVNIVSAEDLDRALRTMAAGSTEESTSEEGTDWVEEKYSSDDPDADLPF
tara:strand:- start:1318 stop:2076 length:759 start_codon:yes stop_codon:yes gene_type:complete